MAKIKHYDVAELEVRSNDDAEQNRVRNIFVELKKRAAEKKELTESEKDFFSLSVKISYLQDGELKDYPVCENFIFKSTYLTYRNNVTGYDIYYKPDRTKIGKMAEGIITYNPKTAYRQVPTDEAKRDIEYLNNESKNWLNTIQTTNHPSSLLNYIAKEGRKQLKSLKQETESRDRYEIGTAYYKGKVKAIILFNKFVYLVALQTMQNMGPEEMICILNGQKIEYNEYSIVHIISRHFAPNIHRYEGGKSFHNMNFKPRQLNLQLKNILEEIERSGYYSSDSLQKIAFSYKTVAYRIYTGTSTKQVAGEGNVNFIRIETFYPIEDRKELRDLTNNYNLVKVNEDLGIYCKK